MKVKIAELKNRLSDLACLKSALAVLIWDEEVYMPAKGSKFRAQTIAYLTGLLHDKFLSLEFEKLLIKAKQFLDGNKLNDGDSAIVREVWREFEREKKLPSRFVKEMAQLCSEAHGVWVEARKKSDFKTFSPYLKKIVAMKREEAKLVGYPSASSGQVKKSPYDALLDVYEPGSTTEEIFMVLEELKDFLVRFIQKIKKSNIRTSHVLIFGNFSIEQQKRFNKQVLEKIGYDFERGRLDVSAHPFTIHFHPDDVRITTRYNEENLFYSLGSTIHEAGHALYEQGILAENFGTPLGESVSLGIHESQSRIWENMVGNSMSFWRYFYPKLQKEFPKPFAKIKLDNFYRSLNHVEPSLIRTESDEVTYNLHIILRFEIEKELIEGTIEVDDLPKIWNSKMKEYFGLKTPNDAMGVLQDVHWSGGSFGYFPTYALGNLYSAQIFASAKKVIPNLEKKFASGQFLDFREWLRRNIHIHGKYYTADKLIQKISGEKLNSKYFIDYLTKKFSSIYKL